MTISDARIKEIAKRSKMRVKAKKLVSSLKNSETREDAIKIIKQIWKEL